MHKLKTTKSKYISHLDDVGGSVEVLPAAATRQWRCRRWHRECAAQTLLGPAHRDGITTAATVSVHTAREARLSVVLLVDVARERVGGGGRLAAVTASRCGGHSGRRRRSTGRRREKQRRGAKLVGRMMPTQQRVLIVAQPATTIVLHKLPGASASGAAVAQREAVGLVIERGRHLCVRLFVLLLPVAEHAPVGVGGGGGGHTRGLERTQAQPHFFHGEGRATAGLLLQRTFEH